MTMCRTETQKAAHRRKAAELHLQGKTHLDISLEIGVSRSTVSKDLKVVEREWLLSSRLDFDAAKARELARIDFLEREAWSAWFESKKESVISSTKASDIVDKKGVSLPMKRVSTSIKKIKRTGNADYLATVQWCIEARCKIRGFFSPVKLDVAELDRILDQVVKDEAAKMLSGDVVSKLKM